MSVSAMGMAITTKTVMMTVIMAIMMTVITKIGLAQDGTMGFGMATKGIIIIIVTVAVGITVMDADGAMRAEIKVKPVLDKVAAADMPMLDKVAAAVADVVAAVADVVAAVAVAMVDTDNRD